MEKNAYVAQAITQEQKDSFKGAPAPVERRNGIMKSGEYDIYLEQFNQFSGTNNQQAQSLYVGVCERGSNNVVPAVIGYNGFMNAHGLKENDLLPALEARTAFPTRVTVTEPTALEQAQAMARNERAFVRRRYEAI